MIVEKFKIVVFSDCSGFGDHAGRRRADSEQRRRAARVGAHYDGLNLRLLGGALVHDHLRGIIMLSCVLDSRLCEYANRPTEAFSHCSPAFYLRQFA